MLNNQFIQNNRYTKTLLFKKTFLYNWHEESAIYSLTFSVHTLILNLEDLK